MVILTNVNTMKQLLPMDFLWISMAITRAVGFVKNVNIILREPTVISALLDSKEGLMFLWMIPSLVNVRLFCIYFRRYQHDDLTKKLRFRRRTHLAIITIISLWMLHKRGYTRNIKNVLKNAYRNGKLSNFNFEQAYKLNM